MNNNIDDNVATRGAKCDICGQYMLEADGCTCTSVECNGKKYKRIKSDYYCTDCGARSDNYHHFGCDMETCPVCGMQMISCDCNITV